MNTDIAAYQQDTWNDGYSSTDNLVVIHTIPMEVSVYEASPHYIQDESNGACMLENYLRAKNEAVKTFRKRIKVN